LPNVGPYIYDVSISGFTRSSIYIYDISSLRVKNTVTKLQLRKWWEMPRVSARMYVYWQEVAVFLIVSHCAIVCY